MKKLFLTSSTITPNLVAPFESLISKSIRDLKCFFIPDAGDAAPVEDKSWIDEERQYLVDSFNWDVTQLRLSEATPEQMKLLEDTDVIFVNGGFSGYLAEVMRNTGFDKLLPSLLNKGIVYVGSSAGSLVLSDVQDVATWFIGEEEPDAINSPGLGHIDFQIYPHYRDELLDQILAKINPELQYFLFRDNAAVEINDRTAKFHGDVIKLIGSDYE